MEKKADRAVVLGAGIAGLLAARALSGRYRRVTLVDRDDLHGPAEPRTAVPQGLHIHALLARGQQALEELFPGLTGELAAAGAPVGDFGANVSWYFSGRMMRRTSTGLVCVAAGRPLLEHTIRARVHALPQVTVRDGTDVVGLEAPDPSRITGVRVRSRRPGSPEEVLPADLVVDATGRGSRTPRLLAELGYGTVRQERVAMDLTYTTCDFEGPLDPDPIGEDIALVAVATPVMPRGAIFARLPDRYSLSLTGLLGDRPPTDHAGFLAYAATLPVPEIHRAVRKAVPLGEPATFRFPASVRRRYEELDRLPEGLVVIGDAACVFNPVYAQGMSVAAMEALLLARQVAEGPLSPRRFMADVAALTDAPWEMAVGADLGFPGVQGLRTADVRMGNSYLPKLQGAAAVDPELSTAFLRAAGLIDPPQALLRPETMARVLSARAA
ncbi:FAD-dependent oxidoreductase [Actinacidiphila sp. DG2A-62]|uniref:FAD-dependent oxidoreductase n=1 Tax=Actinacidiphila sp. DG2A-62 TaxID=3108821 RepID=UPI002DB99674|nr:FAD-dependent oxidoreductase [Actinacidiphila sp. DG2A-62]MEC3992644.1 FAD-dependent oxidoreductase [Actinacidiphila sp. DG2A-62]